jgi:hypothetical protein
MTTADLPVAAPTTGIAWAYRFRADGSAEPIVNEQVDSALAAADAGHRLLRNEHQGPAVSEHRWRHLVGRVARRRRDCLHLFLAPPHPRILTCGRHSAASIFGNRQVCATAK